jgi:hypothetical protein
VKEVSIEEIAAKINKLVTLSEDNSNAAEAEAAWEKAQKLASKHSLDLEQLRQAGKAPAATMEEVTMSNVRSAWHKVVGSSLCQANGCILILAGKSAFVLGSKEDAKVVREMYASIRSQIERLSAIAAKAYGAEGVSGWGHSYRTGMANRVARRLRQAAESVHASTSTALVLTRDTRAAEFACARYPDLRSVTVKPKAFAEVHDLGYRHGDQVLLHKEIE